MTTREGATALHKWNLGYWAEAWDVLGERKNMRLEVGAITCGRKSSDMPDNGHSEDDYGGEKRLHERACV